MNKMKPFVLRTFVALACSVGLVALAGQAAAGSNAAEKLPFDPDTGAPYAFELEAAQVANLELSELACTVALGAPHNVAFGASLAAPTPIEEVSFSATAWALNLALKACKPALDVPRPIIRRPAKGVCEADIRRPTRVGEAKNLFGAQFAVKGDWGDGGSPSVFSWNTDVEVRSSFPGPAGYPESDNDGVFTLGTGAYWETFVAENLISAWDLIFIYVPKLPKGVERFLGGPAGRKAAEKVFQLGVEAGLVAADFNDFLFPNERTFRFREKSREIAVLDRFPPDVSVSRSAFEIEALELGGASVLGPTPFGDTNRSLLETGFTVSDDCDPEVDLIGPVPAFWPLGETTRVVWIARDDGPNEAREPNAVTFEQFVTVVDTLPPTIQPPPDQVVETAGATATVALESPRVFDFGDQDPTISLEGLPPPPTLDLPRGVNELAWSATDDFGQSATAIQRINVKGEGENRPPFAVEAPAVPARTFTPTQILLRGSDPDDDPLSFRIVDFPPDGGFEAPLLPYFIEDFRGNFEARSTCDPGRPFDALAEPQQVKITDEGRTYILDCEGTDARAPTSRISVLDAERNLLAGRSLPRNGSVANAIYESPLTGEILYGAEVFPDLPRFFRLASVTLGTLAEYRAASRDQLSGFNAFMIDANDLLFVTLGEGEVSVFDLRDVIDRGSHFELRDPFLTVDLDPNETQGGGFQAVRDIALTSRGELLFLSAGRIHRMTPSWREADGTPVVGAVTGWLGACASGEGCDLSRNASRGYSCETGVTCNTGEVALFGPNPGQFDGGQSLGVDARDNVYVADFRNSRVQRFTDDGVVAGEAVSECPGDKRCFLLGDFGRPSVISVNRRNLFVLDTLTSVVHTFETSVIEPVDDTTARVVYTANDGFQGTDRFSYAVTDGLDNSPAMPVTINVQRAFRPPVADALTPEGSEDTPLAIRLSATDPDGALDLPLSYEVLSDPDRGTLAGDAPELVYNPPENWYGSTSFTFRAFDGRDYSEPETVAITITPVNDAPVLEFVALDSDDPDTPEIEVTVGYPANFRFKYTDVDDVDLHRFDIEWQPGFRETDVVEPTKQNATPLLVAVSEQRDSSGEVAATFTFEEQFVTETIEACISDNVVLDQGVKNDSTTTLRTCIPVDVRNVPRPELDVAIEAPRVVPGQYDHAEMIARVTNRAPSVGAGVAAALVNVELALPSEPLSADFPGQSGIECAIGATTRCEIEQIPSGESIELRFRLATDTTPVGGDISIDLDTFIPGGEVTAPSATQATMTVGPPADIVVTASEGVESACRFECPRDVFTCPAATSQATCTLSDALALLPSATQDTGNPVVQLAPGTFRVDEASAPYAFEGSIFLQGLGPERTILSGGGQYPLFTASGLAVTVRDLALLSGAGDGSDGPAGSPLNVDFGSRLTLENVHIADHAATSVIRNSGELVLQRASLSDNRIVNYLVEALGVTRLENVMLLDNRHERGDELGLIGNLAGVVRLDSVSAVANGAPVLYSLPGAGFMEIVNSVFADTDQPGCRIDAITARVSRGGNVFRPGSGCPTLAGDVETAEAVLGARQEDAGLPFRAPLAGGPAIDRGAAGCAETDLVGTARPIDGDGDGTAACDAGAIEIVPAEILFADGFEGR